MKIFDQLKYILVLLMLVGININSGQSFAEDVNNVYRAQMGKYHNLNERYRKQKLEVARLEKKNELLQRKFESLQKQADKLSEQIAKHVAKKYQVLDNIAVYQEHFKQYESLAANKEKKYWKKQEAYGRHQQEYAKIKGKKMKAYNNIKKNMDLEVKIADRIAQLEQEHHNVKRKIKHVQKQMIELKKKYDKMVEPIEGL